MSNEQRVDATIDGPRIEAVCVVHELLPDDSSVGTTAIDKRPVQEAVDLGVLGLTGDRQMDVRHHGGPDQAVYAYAAEDADWWADQLQREIAPGGFGENLRTHGVDVSGAVIGERWRVGRPDGPLLEVTAPRIPCSTFARFVDEPRWVKRFTEHGAPGAYLRVLTGGTVRAGDALTVEHVPEHGVTVRDSFHRLTADTAARLLAAADAEGGLDLHASLRDTARAVLARS
jgi:MOSC domain-containing protein YiiM